MLTVAEQFTKFKVAAAASVVATAAVLTPAVAAQAQPITMPSIPASPLSSVFGTDPILGPVQLSTETPWWWIGNSPNPHAALVSTAPLAASGTTIFQFSPLSLVPGFLQPLAGWFAALVPQFSVCFAGLGVSVGPYATLTVKTGAC